MSEEMQRLHAIVRGRVQGVNFRGFAQGAALECGVSGWVRNLPDGTVETVAEGSQSALEAYLRALHKGSSYASVTRVDAQWHPSENAFSDFSIRYGQG